MYRAFQVIYVIMFIQRLFRDYLFQVGKDNVKALYRPWSSIEYKQLLTKNKAGDVENPECEKAVLDNE